jgi:hypothetical protein
MDRQGYWTNVMASTDGPEITTRRFKRVEYERLTEMGIFQPGERLELLDGLLVVREPQGSSERPAASSHLRSTQRTDDAMRVGRERSGRG